MEAYGAGVCGCSQSQPAQQGPTQAPPRRYLPLPPPSILYYGAFAIDQKMQVSASWNNPSAEGVMKSTHDACVKGNGEGCRVICEKAMDLCKSQSKVGKCHMLTGIILVATDDIDVDGFDRGQMSLSDDPLTTLSK
jgi:hypothetical protein